LTISSTITASATATATAETGTGTVTGVGNASAPTSTTHSHTPSVPGLNSNFNIINRAKTPRQNPRPATNVTPPTYFYF
jgi:hypothetical protein